VPHSASLQTAHAAGSLTAAAPWLAADAFSPALKGLTQGDKPAGVAAVFALQAFFVANNVPKGAFRGVARRAPLQLCRAVTAAVAS
jgi:hypothetical protein